MKTEKEIIVYLNQVLTNELVAINQFFLHAKMYKHWDFKKLFKVSYKRSIEAMKNADELADRVLFLEGNPNFQKLTRLYIGKAPQEMLEQDLLFRRKCRELIQDAITLFESENDYISRQLLEKILKSYEDHTDWLEAQFDLIQNTGIQNYLQSQIHED